MEEMGPQTRDPNDDEVKCDDVIQQARGDENKNAGYQSHERLQHQKTDGHQRTPGSAEEFSTENGLRPAA
jgi:hypothetical protein